MAIAIFGDEITRIAFKIESVRRKVEDNYWKTYNGKGVFVYVRRKFQV